MTLQGGPDPGGLGFRPDPANSRWAPSGGNLASPTVYLITGSDLFGLPGTVVRYDDIDLRTRQGAHELRLRVRDAARW